MIALDLSMVRGDTRIYECFMRDSDLLPYDLTGCELTFTAKRLISDPDEDAVFQLTSGDGIIVDDPITGLFAIEIAPEDTYSMTTAATLVCDIQLKASDDRVYTIGKGVLAVAEDVTRTYL